MSMGVQFLHSLFVFISEFLPVEPPPGQLDDCLFYESRLKALEQGAHRSAATVTDALKLNGFWLLVWLIKCLFSSYILIPILFRSQIGLSLAFPVPEEKHDLVSGLPSEGEWGEVKNLVLLELEPARLLKLFLTILLWGTGMLVFLSDTANWYRIVLTFWGGIAGFASGGIARHYDRFFSKASHEQAFCGAAVKLLPALADGSEEAQSLVRLGGAKGWKSWSVKKVRKQAQKSLTSQGERGRGRIPMAWEVMWNAIVDDMYSDFLLSMDEREALKSHARQLIDDPSTSIKRQAIRSKEARRRLQFFLRSLQKPEMPASQGALKAPGLTIVIPVYAEVLTPDLPGTAAAAKAAAAAASPKKGGPGYKELSAAEMGFLRAFFSTEYGHLIERTKDLPAVELQEARRKWMANRYQCGSRCIRGMMKGWEALRMHLRAELPESISDADVARLTSSKFRCVAALQVYDKYEGSVLKDVIQLFDEIPGAKEGGLAIGYISEDGGKLYSCVIDGAKMNPSLPLAFQSEPWVRGKEGVMLRPTYRVELPTDKMGKLIYNGKADNQQSNLIFTRGEILQAIDMNQEGYMEENLKLPCALQEFTRAPPGGAPPSIVGFREYIFSNIGAMGDFAGGSELAFGTLVQRTMAYPLWSRLHYGHPDMLDKLAMVGQGGMSKGDKFVNLSEDIFAGMDATLRGRYITYCDYYQVGKGRDMGADSVLGFFMKLASGTARMTTSRQVRPCCPGSGLPTTCLLTSRDTPLASGVAGLPYRRALIIHTQPQLLLRAHRHVHRELARVSQRLLDARPRLHRLHRRGDRCASGRSGAFTHPDQRALWVGGATLLWLSSAAAHRGAATRGGRPSGCREARTPAVAALSRLL